MADSSARQAGQTGFLASYGLTILIAFPIIYSALQVFYQLFLSPLSRFPGPKSWIAFPFLRNYYEIRGKYDAKIREFHKKYGPVVRYSRNELSFIDAQAWKDIYGHGHAQLPKFAPPRDADIAENIFTSISDSDHSRFRKALSHGFSEKALRDQEPYVQGYIDLLMEKLRNFAETNAKVDLSMWYNFTTFDIIGDLALGESFNCLASSELHFWIENIFKFIRVISVMRVLQSIPLLRKLSQLITPRKLQDIQTRHREFTYNTVMKRLNNKAQHGRGDFIDSMLKHRGEAGEISDGEIVSNASVLIIGGSETTATLLSGVTYWLLKTPHALAKVTEEVRSKFESESAINFLDATARLPYMLACLNEALRRYPPVPTGFSRATLPNQATKIAEHDIPPNTLVSVHNSAAYWSEGHFYRAEEFIPERWLPSVIKDPSSPFYHDQRDALQPFSVGPRNCIGRNLAYNEMRLILARMLYNFDLELSEESQNWHEQPSYTLWDKPPLLVKLSMRQKS